MMTRTAVFALSLSLTLGACSQSSSTPTAAPSSLAQLAGPGAPSGLAYQIGRPAYRAGRAITPNVATVMGANVAFTVAPALPSGLALDATTGTITGTPSGAPATTVHTVTAANGSGSSVANLRITILPFGPPLDSAQFGNAGSMRLVGAVWGRLVDVYDRDANGSARLVARDMLVREDLPPASNYVVETNIATQGTRVTIDAPVGSSAFATAFDALESNLPTIAPAGPWRLPPFPYIPRNATMALVFDDLIDPATLALETVRVSTGVPQTVVQSVRLRTDPNHGNVADRNGDGQFEFWSTRVLIDPVVNEFEAMAAPQPIPVNAIGYPPSSTSTESNLLVRIPTRTDAGSGQFVLLRNLSGGPVSSTGSGPVLTVSPTLDVLRALRTGGPTASTGDAQNGFLFDDVPPRPVAEIPIAVTNVQSDTLGNPEDKRVDVQFANVACAAPLRPGQTLQIDRSILEVLEPSAAPVGASVANVRVKILQRTDALIGAGKLLARFSPGPGAQPDACFLAFDPQAGGAPAILVDPTSGVILRADEALDPNSLSGMDATRIARVASGQGGAQIVPATYSAPLDRRGVIVRPLLPLTHVSGVAETYFVSFGGWRDLAGNTLGAAPVDVPFELDPAAASVATGGVTFRFDSNDMLPGAGAQPDAGSGKPEFRGQFLADVGAGIVQGRPVTRFQLAADRTQAVPSLMVPFAPGVQTPISRYGSKAQEIWRYCDVGLALLDEQFQNIDVEHLYWSPAGGTVFADAITQFEISLSHASKLPDETLDANLLPFWPASGLVATYAQNVADAVNDPLRTVHPGAHGIAGYVVQPSDATVTSGGTPIVPWPLNKGLPLHYYERYTWRDTGLQSTGGANGPGAELAIVDLAQAGQPYAPGSVPTIGLPLLMEYRCYPDPNTLGINRFDVSLAVSTSIRPNFRAFSTGGIATTGSVVIRDPDLESVASGGFNPNSTPVPGAATPPTDNSFAIGAMDLVVRVSRAHSIWLDAGVATSEWATATEPTVAAQPSGSELQLAFRGATSIANVPLTNDATALDAYGDAMQGAQPSFFQADSTWKAEAGLLGGARLLQTRITFVSDAATNVTPALSALGIAWQ